MKMLVLFTPSDQHEACWRVRVFPPPVPGELPGLNQEGECDGLGFPDYTSLDDLMLRRRAGYGKRVHANGVTEITASSEAGGTALRDWVELLIEATRK
jgi:hypothetical protein